MSQHTPTPWVVRQSGDKATIEQDKDRVHPQSFAIGFSSRDPLIVRTVIAHCTEPTFGEGEANAAFIVRACNSHTALVECCKQLHKWISGQGYPIPLELHDALARAGEL